MASGNTLALLALARAQVAFQTHEYDLTASEPSYGESVAATLGVPPARLFKTLVAEVDGKPVVAIVPVSRQLVLKALAGAAGGKRAKMAEAADAERWTGYVTGGISPFGQKRRLPFFVDASLSEHASVYVSGGRRGLQVEVAPDDLIALQAARPVDGLGG
jgi:Cys-tRNA(Pro)/Cys-tRNA(Cys) deacylase